MTGSGFLDRLTTGLWRENPGLVQLLGLCPLLAVTSTFVNGLGLGIATLLVLTFSNVLVSATRRWILQEIRIPVYVLIIASLVTCIELIFKAWFPALGSFAGYIHSPDRHQLRHRRARRAVCVQEHGTRQLLRRYRHGCRFCTIAHGYRLFPRTHR